MTVLRITFVDGEWWEVDTTSHHIVGVSAGLGVVWASGKIAVDPTTLAAGRKPRFFAHGLGAGGDMFGRSILDLQPAVEIAGATPLEMEARS